MINPELKKAIIEYLFNHINTFNRLNCTKEEFKNYIYDDNWNYLIWWKDISDWISTIEKLI